jgi:glutathione S-transferase
MRAAGHAKLRLHYLDTKALGEPIRLALFIGGIEFEDVRVSYEQVDQMRKLGQLPFGQVPVLEINGEVHGQSGSLLRWAGRQAGLYPEASALRCDAIEGALDDIRVAMRPHWYGHALGRDPRTGQLLVPLSDEQRADTARLLRTDVLPPCFAQLESALGSRKYFCGDQLTFCDLSFFVMGSGILDGTYCEGMATVLDDCPRLCEHVQRVRALPRVSEWHERRAK